MESGGRRNRDEYVTIIAEVVFDPVKGRNRVRPAPDQKFQSALNIECANEIKELPLGTKIHLNVVLTERQGSKEFLFSSYKWPYEKIVQSSATRSAGKKAKSLRDKKAAKLR